MFVNVQHPGAQATPEEFAAGTFGSGFPDYDGNVPRSATLVITREDGGVIGACSANDGRSPSGAGIQPAPFSGAGPWRRTGQALS